MSDDKKDPFEEDCVTIKVEVEIKVPKEDWIDYLTKYPDIFSRDYIGYWGFGYPIYNKDEECICNIVIEFDDDEDGDDLIKRGQEAERCFRDRLPLPERCHLLDEAAAIKAYAEGCKKWGADWFEEKGDANTYDWVLQQAFLGKQVYG